MRDAPLSAVLVIGGGMVYFGLTCLLEGQVLWGIILLVGAVVVGGAVTR